MNISKIFLLRPVGTTLLTIALAVIGAASYFLLPVDPLPRIDLPVIIVQARVPGASPETMAATVATPLERSLGRIAGITEMTSESTQGRTSVILQFDLDRNINGAARDVQAAINAARSSLPSMPSNPTYWKINPADMPIMLIGLSSDTVPIEKLYALASTVLSQKIAQVQGVGEVQIGGSSLPAIRVSLNPGLMSNLGISLGDVGQALSNANANLPKGMIDDGSTRWTISANDQLEQPEEFANLIIRKNGKSVIRLSDVGEVYNSVEEIRNAGYANGKRSVLLIVYKEPGANIIDTVRRVRKELPLLYSWMPKSVKLTVTIDRSPAITASVHDVEQTLVVSMGLVILVVFLFLRNGRATIIPAVAVPVSLLGTFSVMYLCGFSLNHLSLMALTIATGFVVDDAIVVTENIVRYIEKGETPLQAAIKGSKEVAFTVVSISISLVAIFIPVLGMGGIVGKLFKEFSVTLSAAVLVSLVVSLITTPMMCGHILRKEKERDQSMLIPGKLPFFMAGGLFGLIARFLRRILRIWSDFLDFLQKAYAKTLKIVLYHKWLTLLSLILTVCLNVYLYIVIPKGFFPQQDTGQIMGRIEADQSISFHSMRPKFLQMASIVQNHPDVLTVGGFTGGRQSNTGSLFITLKPLGQRKKKTMEVINELRNQLSVVPGTVLRMQPVQDIRSGGRQSRAMYQYTLRSDDLKLLRTWAPKIFDRFHSIPGIIDLNTDQESKGLQTNIEVDRSAIARYGVTFKDIDASLGLAFGQSFVSTIYSGVNQYRVVMELAPEYLKGPDGLLHLYVPATEQSTTEKALTNENIESKKTGSTLIPLSVFSKFYPSLTELSVSHQEQFSAATLSFNLLPGYSLSNVEKDIKEALFEIGVPSEVRGGFEGTARMYGGSVSQQPLVILAALVTLYIVLGVLYESLIHPLTILSTLPSAGIGALLGLMAFNTEFTVIAFIGVLLLCGIVKKNAIIMIDFAIVAKRDMGLSALDAIYKACLLRFRPIMMTTMAAIFGAIPLLISSGEGSEIRTPLGITIVGGLLVSQILTLYTTPVVYLFLDRFSKQKTYTLKSNFTEKNNTV